MPRLVISRRIGETVHVGDARTTVIEAWRGRTRLVIEAPIGVKVRREELREREAEGAGK